MKRQQRFYLGEVQLNVFLAIPLVSMALTAFLTSCRPTEEAALSPSSTVFAPGLPPVDINRTLKFRTVTETVTSPTVRDLWAAYYEPDTDTLGAYPSHRTILRDLERDMSQVIIGTLPGGESTFTIEFALGENILEHINFYGAQLSPPRVFTPGELDLDFFTPGNQFPEDGICSDEFAQSTADVPREVRVCQFTIGAYLALGESEGASTGTVSRKYMTWRYFDPFKLPSQAIRNAFLKFEKRDLIATIDETFIEENLASDSQVAATYAAWNHLGPWSAASLAAAVRAEPEASKKINQLLPPHLKRTLGYWNTGKLSDCVQTAMLNLYPNLRNLEAYLIPRALSHDYPNWAREHYGALDHFTVVWGDWINRWLPALYQPLGLDPTVSLPHLFEINQPITTGSLIEVVKDSGLSNIIHHVVTVVGAIVRTLPSGKLYVEDLLLAERDLTGIRPVHLERYSVMMARVQPSDNTVSPLVFNPLGIPIPAPFTPAERSYPAARADLVGRWQNCRESTSSSSPGSFLHEIEFKEFGVFSQRTFQYSSSNCTGEPTESIYVNGGLYIVGGAHRVFVKGLSTHQLDLIITHSEMGQTKNYTKRYSFFQVAPSGSGALTLHLGSSSTDAKKRPIQLQFAFTRSR